MSTRYKDYPIYTYDEPAIYNDFSGGINTDPSNEHLLANELRDCLNMDYNSAALVKRKGASLLCNIECEDVLQNIQGVFLFTYRVTYMIVAADGKLYKGFYSPNSTISLTRLPITIDSAESLDAFNPLDLTAGLTEMLDMGSDIKHDGFVYKYIVDKDLKKIDMSRYFIGDYTTLTTSRINNLEIVKYYGDYYRLNWKTKDSNGNLVGNAYIDRVEIDTYNKTYWLTLDEYNERYAEDIAKRTDILSTSYNWINNINTGLVLNTETNMWERSVQEGPGLWSRRKQPWEVADAVTYFDVVYICIHRHTCILNAPDQLIASPDAEWVKLTQKKELVFQNHDPIEAATYNNKMYITTGTRFVVVELVTNELVAHVVSPYSCNTEEIINIGYNYLSPYPELCRSSRYNQAITSIGGLIAVKNIFGNYTLTPQMNFAGGETEKDYYFKWEKRIGNNWVTVFSFKDNVYETYTHKYVEDENGTFIRKDGLYVPIKNIDDFSRYKQTRTESGAIDYTPDINGDYTRLTDYDGNLIYYELALIIKAAHTVTDQDTKYRLIPGDKVTEKLNLYTLSVDDADKYQYRVTFAKAFAEDAKADNNDQATWTITYKEEKILREDGSIDHDWVIDKVDGEYFGQSVSVLATDLKVEDTFTTIHSCKKITSDGNKFLLYDDRYSSGSWYKTIIDNPTYITHRGGLSFKTNKNESLIKVIAFNGNLIAFANAENVGGSIHLVTGNGDDYDAQDGYYSPYRRFTINSAISCDNAKTVQVCENILVFKYFDTLYYISGSELNNEVISVYSCNDKIRHNNNFVRIPWDDNSCISEVTENYYALIWKEQYRIENDTLVLDRPALKIKMYYKLGKQQNEKIVFPWLRDESEYFNTDHILYIKGKPIYLYNNTLTTFNNEVYTDFDKVYTCSVHFRGEDLNYPKMYKLIGNVLVYYHRNQYSNIDFDLVVKNEAGHVLLGKESDKPSISDLRALKAEDTVEDGKIRLDSTILDSKVFNTTYKFPCLLADATITVANDKEFSISSITYNYTTSETPESTSYDLYTNILRPNETRATIADLLKSSALKEKISSLTDIESAITGIKIKYDLLDNETLKMQAYIEINLNGKVDYIPFDLFHYDANSESLVVQSVEKEDNL